MQSQWLLLVVTLIRLVTVLMITEMGLFVPPHGYTIAFIRYPLTMIRKCNKMKFSKL